MRLWGALEMGTSGGKTSVSRQFITFRYVSCGFSEQNGGYPENTIDDSHWRRAPFHGLYTGKRADKTYNTTSNDVCVCMRPSHARIFSDIKPTPSLIGTPTSLVGIAVSFADSQRQQRSATPPPSPGWKSQPGLQCILVNIQYISKRAAQIN